MFESLLPWLVGGSAVVSAASSIKQGKAAQAAANYNAEVQQQNAAFAYEEAQELVRIHDRETYLRLGAINAAQGANGGAAGEGSVYDVFADVTAESERERQFLIRSGEMKARGFEATAALDRMSGSAARQASYMRAGSELLSGGANALYQRDRLRRA
jgi:hypothetical protein